MRSLQFYLMLVMVFFGSLLQSQADEFVALRKYEAGDYDAAIKTYREVLSVNPNNEDAMLRIAESLRMKGHISEAVEWYAKVADIEKPAKPFLFNYAKSLQELGYYNRAKNWFLKYAEIDPVKGMHFALSCDYALQEDLRSDGSAELNLYIKGQGNYKWPMLNEGTVSYWTDDTDENSFHWYTGNLKDYKNGVESCKAELLNDFNSFAGPSSVHKSGDLVAVTKMAHKNMIMDPKEGMDLFIGTRSNTSEKITYKPFPFNVTGYSTSYPYWSQDDAALYFSSNRPGGFGGYDLYVSYYENGKWSYPQNLGERVNSQGNEISPVLKDGTLYFSSNWHSGFGGYDIFKADLAGFSFGNPENMGIPVNSPSNEWGLQYDNTYTFAIFNTDRKRPGHTDIMHLQYIHESADALANVASPEKVEPIALLPRVNAPIKVADAYELNSAMFTSYKLEDKKVETTENVPQLDNRDEVDEQSTAFFIQVAALSKSKGSIDQFKPLAEFGNVYRVEVNGLYKIRIGVFNTMGSAVEALKKVKSAGYNDAYVTQEKFNSATLDLIISGKTKTSIKPAPTVSQKQKEIISPNTEGKSTTGKVYKVRLTAYHYNTQFDTRSVKDLGEIEQWTKGTWKIILLGGFKSIDQAKQALSKAMARGYKDAYLVVEEDGLLLPYEE